MARKSTKCPPTVDTGETGCVWNFNGMFDHHHHHGRSHRRLLSDEIHMSKSVPGHARSQVPILTFDEQLRTIKMESKKKTASVNESNHAGETMERSFWKKIKSRYDNANKKKENTNLLDRIVVLKPNHRVLEPPVDVGCRCSYLLSHQSSTSKQQLIKHTHYSSDDVRRKLKSSKKLKSIAKMKSSNEIAGKGSRNEKISLVPFSKKQEPEVFVEARRHLAERLRLVARGAGLGEPLDSSSKRVSRTLERVLLSSPKHVSMAKLGLELEGTHGVKGLQKRGSGSSPLNHNEYTSASGFVEIMDEDHYLLGHSNFLNLDSDPQTTSSSGTDGCIKGSNLEFSLDVSSPKVDCKSENTYNDQFRDNPSPVSVLDPFFSDNICSPTSTVESVELQIHSHRLDFEEHSSLASSPQPKTSLSSFAEDRRFISSYIDDIYQFSQSNWEQFLESSSCDHDKLLHDCVKEVLVSLHSRISFISSKVRPFSLQKDVVNEVVELVDWHNGQPVGPRTLEHLVKRDIAKCGEWDDTLSDKNDVVFEVVDETLQELILEAVHDIYV